MNRPVRPIALVLLTACAAYPGITMLYQGLYTFVAGEHFNLVGQVGPWMMLAQKMSIPPVAVLGLKALLGAAWVFGVLGLWAGDGRALPLVGLAAVGSLLYPWGPIFMGALALICLLFFREAPDTIPA
jgi:hypothetical protein